MKGKNAHLLSNILDTKLGEWSPNSRLIGELDRPKAQSDFGAYLSSDLTSKLI